MASIAFLGLGAMGSRMAANLIKAGHTVTVWNRSPAASKALSEQGAWAAATPRDAAKGSEFVISMVTDDNAARDVWLNDKTGAIHGLDPNAVAIESSTVSRDWVLELSEALKGRGTPLIDAPVAGSRPQAEAAQLIFMVGGEKDVVDKARPVLSGMGHIVSHVGPVGQGATLKLAVNAYFAVQLAAMAEMLAFLGRNGFSETAAADLLAGLPVVSPALAGAGRMMATRNTSPMFTVDLISKDLDYILAAAQQQTMGLETVASARKAFGRAQDKGLGGQNITALATLAAA